MSKIAPSHRANHPIELKLLLSSMYSLLQIAEYKSLKFHDLCKQKGSLLSSNLWGFEFNKQP